MSQKMTYWVRAKGQVNLSKKVKTCLHYDITHRESQIQN